MYIVILPSHPALQKYLGSQCYQIALEKHDTMLNRYHGAWSREWLNAFPVVETESHRQG